MLADSSITVLTTAFLYQDKVAGIEPTTVHVKVTDFSVLILTEDGFNASKFKPLSSQRTGPVLSSESNNVDQLQEIF